VRSRPRYRPLAWRVFAVNAAVLVAAGLVAILVFSPGSVSETVASQELVIVAVGLVAMLAVNRLALGRAFAPLERVVTAMRRADVLAPGRRLAVPDRASEASDVALAFNDMLARLEDERRASTRRALGAQEAERRRIARELHDEIGQELTALLLQLTSARRVADPELQPVLTEVHGLAREALDDVRRVARELRPEALDDLGLVSALAALGERLHQQTGLRVRQHVPPSLPPLTEEQELVLYRVAQEALTNVIRHAGCADAELSLHSEDEQLVLEVRDRGAGFDPEAVQATGMLGMRERALLVGARLDIHSQPGQGTLVRLALPLA
jgi:two-component system sensor histidine kinase UhpB